MDDSKVFMFPDGGTRQSSNDVNSLLPLLMCSGGFGGGSWIWIIFLFFLYPLMRNGGLFGNTGTNGGCLGPYDDEERYHEREEYGHRERGRYGRY